MLLRRLQNLIAGIYDVRVAHDVYDFLVTDRGRLPAAARSGVSDETLVISQPLEGEEADDVGVSLYLDPGLLSRLDAQDPTVRLHGGNVADYCTALEGVSHFVYLAWNAGHDRPVSVLELEMQAEVDKYVASYWLMRQQLPGRLPAELRRILFERSRVDPRLAGNREELYRQASRHAERFCRSLERTLTRTHGRWELPVLAELRRFYRLSQARKLAHISSLM